MSAGELLARYRSDGGSLTTAAFLAARNDLIAGVVLIALAGATALTASGWADIIVGLLLVVIGGALHLRTSVDVWMLVLVGAFQLVTAPVTAHVVGRLAHRGDGVRRDLLHVDELDDSPDAADPGPDGAEPDTPAEQSDAPTGGRGQGS